MQDRLERITAFSDDIEDAGIGSLIWSQRSYRVAKGYHYIVGAATGLIVFITLLSIDQLLLAITSLVSVVVYIVLRSLVKPQSIGWFYDPRIQFMRGQLGIVCVTLLLILAPREAGTSLWLLYLLALLPISKYHTTSGLVVAIIEACLALVLVRLSHTSPISFVQAQMNRVDLWDEILLLGLSSFILHYLIRNIQARTQTINSYSAVNALARSVDMQEGAAVRPWMPLLSTLIAQLGGECASAWILDSKTEQLEVVASARRSKSSIGETEILAHELYTSVPLNGTTIISKVARTGEFASWIGLPPHVLAQTEKPDPSIMSPEVKAQLVLPINIGTPEHRSTIGVLSTGFRAKAFNQSLLTGYRDFMEALINQAKPMLVCAQRLNELEDLQTISRRVFHNLDFDGVLESVLDVAVDTLGFQFAVISLVDDDLQVIRSLRGRNVSSEWLDMASHPLNSTDIQADIIRSGKTEVIKEWDERFDRRIWDKFGHKDMIRVFAPIRVIDSTSGQERSIGTIEAGYHGSTRSDISQDQLHMLNAFTNQVSMAIEHTRLLQRVQTKATILTGLHHLGQSVASTHELPQVMGEIAGSAKELLKSDIVMIYPYDRRDQKIEQPWIFGDIWGKFTPNLNLDHENILTRLVGSTEPYYSPDAQWDPQFAFHTANEMLGDTGAKRTLVRRQNIKSVAGIPLVANGETVGVMLVNYRKRHQFDPDERQVHELFAQQAAVAIRTAEMNRHDRERILRQERNRLSRELHHTVSHALFSVKLLTRTTINRLGNDQEAIRSQLNNVWEVAHTASLETGFITDELQAPLDESQSLDKGLEAYIQRIKRWYSMDVGFESDMRRTVSQQVAPLLLQIAREALNNAVRHSHCRSIQVCCKTDDRVIRIAVHDDGDGFDRSRVPHHRLGLKSMDELAHQIGANLVIDTAPGAGTTVQVEIDSDTESDIHE